MKKEIEIKRFVALDNLGDPLDGTVYMSEKEVKDFYGKDTLVGALTYRVKVPKVKKSGWTNVYKGSSPHMVRIGIYPTEALAVQAGKQHPDHIVTTKIEWEE